MIPSPRRLLLFTLLIAPASLHADDEPLWNLDQLKQPPGEITWVDAEGPLRRLYYSGEPYMGNPTRVFAYCAFPADVEGRAPGIVLIHGGGGTAFREWAELWSRRGYVAIAMDLAGRGEDKERLPDGGPDQGDEQKFPRQPIPLTDMWSYHAVANCIRAHSLLRSLPEVDPERTAVTGISWGGYLTCIVAGLDDRFKAVVPVYGCGFLHENSVWLPRFASQMESEWSRTWIARFDPSAHVGRAQMPMLFVNGTNDFAYPLDSYKKTCRLVKDRTLCVTVRMPHGHPAGWAPVEIELFVEQHLNGKPALPTIDREIRFSEDLQTASANFSCANLKAAQFHMTTDGGAWQQREWQSLPVLALGDPTKGTLTVTLPAERPFTGFFTVTDDRGATVSTEHFELLE